MTQPDSAQGYKLHLLSHLSYTSTRRSSSIDKTRQCSPEMESLGTRLVYHATLSPPLVLHKYSHDREGLAR